MSKKKTPVAVTRTFLLNLANDIYNPKTKKFLRLCDGTLENGPDPTDETRPMHCGLGELYFAMTGVQPRVAGVCEDDVIDLALDRSPLVTNVKAQEELAKKALKSSLNSLKLDKYLKHLKDSMLSQAIGCIEEHHQELIDTSSKASKFQNILDKIPGDNDDSCGDHCDDEIFQKRSARVAKLLRQAAKVLPA